MGDQLKPMAEIEELFVRHRDLAKEFADTVFDLLAVGVLPEQRLVEFAPGDEFAEEYSGAGSDFDDSWGDEDLDGFADLDDEYEEAGAVRMVGSDRDGDHADGGPDYYEIPYQNAFSAMVPQTEPEAPQPPEPASNSSSSTVPATNDSSPQQHHEMTGGDTSNGSGNGLAI